MEIREKFTISIINWLSEFPGSPVSSNLPPSSLSDPSLFYSILRLLMEDDSAGEETADFSKDTAEIMEDDGYIKISSSFLEQVRLIIDLIERHLQKNFEKLKKIEYLRQLYKDISFFELFILKDLNALCTACKFILKVGIYSSKLSTFGLTSIEFLSNSDKDSINNYLGPNYRDIEARDDLFSIRLEELKHKYEIQLKEAQEINKLKLSNKTEEGVSIIEKLKNNVAEYHKKYEEQKLRYQDLISRTENLSYIEEEYVNSLLWENKKYEELIYSTFNK